VNTQSFAEGVILGLSVAAPVGPTNIELIRRGLKGGFSSCIFFSIGVDIALVVYLVAVFAGLTFLTQVKALNFLLSVFGVVVLLFLGYSGIKDFSNRDALDLTPGAEDRHLLSGVMLTISNPAVLLFWSGIIGANVATRDLSGEGRLLISAGILLGVSAWLFFLSLLVHGGRRFITPRIFGYVSAIAGVILIGFGLTFGYRLVLQLA
jgi:threonine/homoserine/homoserine lactone efflux protein